MAITKKYDRTSLFLMLFKFYHHLHPLFEAKNFLIYIIDADTNLDIFSPTPTNLQRNLLTKNC